MTRERWQQISSVWHKALERPPDERLRFVREACAGDQGLQREVESLLAYDGDTSLLETPAALAAASPPSWIMPLGGEPVLLTSDPAPDWAPHWSPDGTTIAFYSARTGDREIWKMPAAGGAATRLTDSPGLDAGSNWSPDGGEIAFRSERAGSSDIGVVSADGSRLRQLTDHPGSDGLPSWSPDGRWLAFTSNRTGSEQIWVMPSAGGEGEPLTAIPARSPRWSADGYVYFPGGRDRVGDLWRVSVANRREQQLTDLRGRRGEPGRMPPAIHDGILYFTWRDDTGDIWVMDVVEPSN